MRAMRRIRTRTGAGAKRLAVVLLLSALALATMTPVAASAVRSIMVVSVDDFVATRILEIDLGTEVVFSDRRFLNVDILADEGAPEVTRTPTGFAATFDTPGTFRFLATLVSVERPGIVPGHIIVRPHVGVLGVFDYASAKPGVTETEFIAAQSECLRDPRTAGSSPLYLLCMQSRGVIPFE